MPLFALHTWRSLRQLRASTGFQGGEILMDRAWTFWTMTAWNQEADMRRYMAQGAHLQAMPRLREWCVEASVVHWEQASAALPTWIEADRRMREDGRPSKVRDPSPNHADVHYPTPRTTARGPIRPRRTDRRA